MTDGIETIVGAERDAKLLVEELLGGAGSALAGRICVGFPGDEWLRSTPLPRAIVMMTGAEVIDEIATGTPTRTVEVPGAGYVEEWYPVANAECLMEVHVQTDEARGGVVNASGQEIGLGKLTRALLTGLYQGRGFYDTEDSTGEYQVISRIRFEDVFPRPDAAVRRFARVFKFTARGPLYEVRREYVAQTVEGNVVIEGEGD